MRAPGTRVPGDSAHVKRYCPRIAHIERARKKHNMKAVAVFPSDKKVALIEHDEPEITAKDQVKLRMLDVGVCGTDREIVSFDYGTPPKGSPYLIIGHESLGEVVAIGKQVTNVKTGDLAVLTVRRPCAEMCPACAEGRQDFCYTGHYSERGIVRHHGYMTEYVVEHAAYVNPVPPELRDIGVLTEPLTIAEKGYEEIEIIQQRMPWTCPDEAGGRQTCHTALVLGAGPVGLLGAMKLVIEGFRTFVYSRGSETEKPPLVQAIGATFLSTDSVKPKDLPAACGAQIDVVYEAMGAADLAFAVIRELGRNAIFVFTGVPGRKNPIPVDTATIMRDMVLKNQLILGTVNASPLHFQNAIADLGKFRAKFPHTVANLITRRYPIEEYRQPLSNHGGIKNVISLNGA